MLIPILLLCFVTLEAKKQRDDSPVPPPKNLGKLVKIEDAPFQRPVDFLHLYREGYGDKDYKQPIHLLEEDMIKPKNREHAIQLLEKTDKHNVQWLPADESLVFNSPRDEFLYYKKMINPSKNSKVFGDKSNVYDFLTMLERNLAYPEINIGKHLTQKNSRAPSPRYAIPKNITEMFEENGFDLKRKADSKNITTCDEFSKKALYHPHDIVNTQWLPFYIWSERDFSTAVVHMFTYPTKKRVNYYKTAFGSYVKNIDWSHSKLLLKERREILLIASNKKGLYYGIPDQEPPKPEHGNLTLPAIIIRLKIHSPYLAMMFCDDFYVTIMAEVGTVPATDDDKIREASTLGIRGVGLAANQDIETEKLLSQVEHLRKMESEDRKIIKIKKIVGDVDYAVRH